MKGIHHDNIVQYLGTLVKDNILNIFMEYIPPAITPYVPCGLAIG
jgi:hypothetical protein